MWFEGRLAEIVAYNECDALSTYLIWLRMAYFGGYFDQLQYSEEQSRVRNLLSTEETLPGKEHLLEFLERTVARPEFTQYRRNSAGQRALAGISRTLGNMLSC
jgi:hypothetical protein